MEAGAARLERALAELEQGEATPELAEALAELPGCASSSGTPTRPRRCSSGRSPSAEALQLSDVFVEALTSKGVMYVYMGRLAEARVLLEAAIARAHAEQLYVSEARATNNLGALAEASDRFGEVLELIERMLPAVRRLGDRRWETLMRLGGLPGLFLLGDWDQALTVAGEEEPRIATEDARASLLPTALIHVERGDGDAARAVLAATEAIRDSDHPETRATYPAVEARILRAEGRYADALAAARRALGLLGDIDITSTYIKYALAEAIEAAIALGDLDAADELLAIPEALKPGHLTPLIEANTARLRARVDAGRGRHDEVDGRFRLASARYREFGMVFYDAVAQLEHAEWLAGQGRGDEAEPLRAHARETFERLGARPWIERAGAGARPEVPA